MKPEELLSRAGLPAYPLVPLTGGDVAQVFRAGPYVLKLRPNPPKGFFPSEAEGLKALAQKGVRVPRVMYVEEGGLVLEYLPPGRPDWEGLARMLARLHGQREARYGGGRVFLGPFPLPEGMGEDWTAFFYERRIQPLLEAVHTELGPLASRVEQAFGKNLPTEGPVLLHGDLWHGNVYFAQEGPALLDPSAWVGERGVDLAMMHLFGGFPKTFWQVYEALLPIPTEVRRALPCYQIYYLLVHVLLFGRSYLAPLERVLGEC
ncbi:MAG: fructosamine kinase family protein [Thermaceae bacterium]